MDNPSDAEIEAACVAWLNTSGPLEPAMRAIMEAEGRS